MAIRVQTKQVISGNKKFDGFQSRNSYLDVRVPYHLIESNLKGSFWIAMEGSVPPQNNIPTYIPLDQAARQYGLSKKVLTQQIQAGKIQAVARPGDGAGTG